MRILILTYGTRGDVQPFLALARELRVRGHEVILGAPAEAAGHAESYGVRTTAIDGVRRRVGTHAAAGSEANKTAWPGARKMKHAVHHLREIRDAAANVLIDMAAAAEEGADVVVHHAVLPGHEVAERLGVPALAVCPGPMWVPTTSFPYPMMPFRLPRALNRMSYLSAKLVSRVILGSTRKWRTEVLGLPRRRRQGDVFRRPDGTRATVLQPFSRHVLPAPLDYPDWVHTTGFWFLPAPQDWAPSQELSDFLAAGDPPIYVGFGSMVRTDPERTARIVAEAIRLTGVRAVVAAGWGGIELNALVTPGEEVFCLDEAPHDWLFPRMAAVVHHGGGGTTAAALASGRPQVLCPFMADQPFNAKRMQASGVAPLPQPHRAMSADGLANAIRRAVTDRTMATRADELGHIIRAEDGVTTAVEVLESVA